jgi:uncharacterized RDD family membrane protein YckC
MQTIRITTSQNIDIDYELAGLGERIVASLIDYGMFILVLILCSIATASFNTRDVGMVIYLIVYAVLFVFYDLACEVFMNGQSVGKKVMKIRVMSLDGSQPRLGQYILRWLFRIIDFGVTMGAVALVVAAISEKVQRIGDIVAGTILIKTASRTKIEHIAFRPAYDNYQPQFTGVTELSEQDIELINEVINSYIKTGNNVLVYNMALRIKERLGLTPPAEMNDMRFLQAILKDYAFTATQTEEL